MDSVAATEKEIDQLKKEIDQQCKVSGNPTHTGTNFCRWVLTQIYDLTEEEAEDALCGGESDAGIDAFFDRNGILTLVQAKYSAQDAWAEITRFINDTKFVVERQLNEREKKRLAPLLARLAEISADGSPVIRRVYVTASRFSAGVAKKIGDLKEDNLETYDLPGIVYALREKVANISPRWRGKKVTFAIEGHFIAHETAVCAVPLPEIAKLANESDDYLFASNVRHYLGKSKINQRMAETLNKRVKDFWFFNNGVTLVCDDYSIAGQQLTITTPQVVNGCQTVTTIRNVARTEPHGSLKDGSVLVRIIKAINDEKRQEITKNTNSQNAVRGKDLFSLERFHKDMKKELHRLGYYYEIQRGAATQLSPSKKRAYKGADNLRYLEPKNWNHVIPSMEAVQAYAASFKYRPEIAHARSQELTPLGSFYSEVFTEDLKADPNTFLYPFLVVQYAKDKFQYGRGASDWRRVGYFFFATVVHMLVALIAGKGDSNSLAAGTAAVIGTDYQVVFENRELGEKVLHLADEILQSYFDDGLVEQALKQDFHGDFKNLMKRKLQGTPLGELLVTKIVKAYQRHRKNL